MKKSQAIVLKAKEILGGGGLAAETEHQLAVLLGEESATSADEEFAKQHQKECEAAGRGMSDLFFISLLEPTPAVTPNDVMRFLNQRSSGVITFMQTTLSAFISETLAPQEDSAPVDPS